MLMLTSLLCSFFFPPLVLAATALPVESAATELRQLTAADFSSSTKHGLWFVEFFSPYCSHCRAFVPTWKRLVEHVESQDNRINLAQVNCVTEGDLCNMNDVQGYPSLKLYQGGKLLEEFQGDRDFDLLTEFVDKHARTTGASKTPNNPTGAVLPLDKSTFHKVIREGPAFVKFYAPWCGHCKKLAPTWIQFAARMKSLVTVAEVNCDDHGSLCSSQGIQGYPTIFFYQHGRTLDYTGRRTLEAMESFAASALAPPLTHISSVHLASLVDEYDVSFLLIHDKLDAVVGDVVEEASQPLHGSPQIFSIDASSELLASLSLPAAQPLPVIVSLKDHSMVAHRQLVVSTSSSVEQVSDWLMIHSLPTSTELDAENFSKVMASSPPIRPGSPSRLVVLGAINNQNLTQIDFIKQIAISWHRGEHTTDSAQVVFAWVDKEKWAGWLKSIYSVKKGPDPAVVIADHGRLLYYDSFPSGASITLEKSSIFAALEGIRGGVLRPRHSENIVERFARWLNGWVFGFRSAISHHPVRSVLLLAITLAGVIFGIKRVLEEDTRKTSVYNNGKPGARLD